MRRQWESSVTSAVATPVSRPHPRRVVHIYVGIATRQPSRCAVTDTPLFTTSATPSFRPAARVAYHPSHRTSTCGNERDPERNQALHASVAAPPSQRPRQYVANMFAHTSGRVLLAMSAALGRTKRSSQRQRIYGGLEEGETSAYAKPPRRLANAPAANN